MISASSCKCRMTTQLMVTCVALVNCWTFTVNAALSGLSSTQFTLTRMGQTPMERVWPATAIYNPVDTLLSCALCCRASPGCSGFMYISASCNGSNTAFFRMLQFFDLSSVVFGPAALSCLKFYAATPAVDPVLPSLALRHDAFQITTWSYAYASYAVDGDLTTSACTANTGAYPWWAVDLLQSTAVTAVKVTNDVSFIERLDNFIVGVTNIKPVGGAALTAGRDFILCAQYSGRVSGGATAQVLCTPPSSTQYRYVVVQGTYWGQPICLREVQVF